MSCLACPLSMSCLACPLASTAPSAGVLPLSLATLGHHHSACPLASTQAPPQRQGASSDSGNSWPSPPDFLEQAEFSKQTSGEVCAIPTGGGTSESTSDSTSGNGRIQKWPKPL